MRLAVTCHLHFRQNDRDHLRATAVTRGRNGYRNKSQHRKLTSEITDLSPLPASQTDVGGVEANRNRKEGEGGNVGFNIRRDDSHSHHGLLYDSALHL